jgi:hypothetical protein
MTLVPSSPIFYLFLKKQTAFISMPSLSFLVKESTVDVEYEISALA